LKHALQKCPRSRTYHIAISEHGNWRNKKYAATKQRALKQQEQEALNVALHYDWLAENGRQTTARNAAKPEAKARMKQKRQAKRAEKKAALREAGIPFREPKRASEQEIAEWQKLHKEKGLSGYQIAKLYPNRDSPTIRYWLR
jgi:hypothetical protein